MTKTISLSKRFLAMLLAMLMLFSGMAVSASAEGEAMGDSASSDTGSLVIPKPTFELFETSGRIAATAPTVAGYTIKVKINVSPKNPDDFYSNGNVFYFSNLDYGVTYTLRAYAEGADGAVIKESDPVSVTLKKKFESVGAPVPVSVTSTSIKIAAQAGCEYMISGGEWQDTVVFNGLTPETFYVVSIRKKATDMYYASDISKITIKTLKAAKPQANKPIFVDKTNTTIVVKEVPGVQFSIDKGNTWQSSGTFKNLKANTVYGIYARTNYDPALEDPSMMSPVLEVQTNAKTRYTATVGKCSFTVNSDKVYANEESEVVVLADGHVSVYTAEYGDTRLIPDRLVLGEDVEENIVGKFSPTGNSNKYVANLYPGKENANKTITVTVVYRVEKFNGDKAHPDDAWDATNQILTSHHKVKVGPVNNFFTKLKEFFVSIGNFFLNTLPQLITDVFGGETAQKFYKWIEDILGQIGKPQT